MRNPAPALVVTVLLSLGACANDDGGSTSDADASEGGTGPATAPAGVPDPTDLAGARAVAQQFYDAIGPHDCITLRGLSTVDEQQEDDAWADCIDVLLDVAGDDYAYTVQGETLDGDRATLTMAITSTVDGEAVSREDPLVLVRQDGAWRVDDSLVTAG